jgi:hypothetical protein
MLRACVVLAFIVIGPAVALAEEAAPAAPAPAPRLPPAPNPAVKAAMEDYFAGEKHGGYLLAGLGAAGLASGALLYRSSSLRARGASYTLLSVGLLHLAAGVYVYIASDGRIDKFGTQIERDAPAFVTAERKRMAGVSTQFTVLKVAEIVLIAGGLTMAGVGWRTDRPRLAGAGAALALEMALTLGFDIWASRRAHGYRDELAQLDVSASLDRPHDRPHDRPRPIVMLGHAGTF